MQYNNEDDSMYEHNKKVLENVGQPKLVMHQHGRVVEQNVPTIVHKHHVVLKYGWVSELFRPCDHNVVIMDSIR